ncbi:MAG: hypothetical protein M3O15_05930 [Acidobacteriota bacterium]|nr:hypothetical protein [Acidobacteriota bacterium]
MSDTNLKETAEKALDSANDTVSAARDKFQSQYKKVYEDVRRGAERATGEVKRGAEAARETYEETAQKVRHGYHKAKKDAVRISGDVSEYVRENPGKSVLVAAGIGFLVGLLVSRFQDED